MKKPFKAARHGFILGEFYKEGADVPISVEQAKYLAPPLGTDLVPPSASRPQTKPASPPAAKSEKD